MISRLKNLKLPHVFVLLVAVIFVCSLCTYVVPSGSYERASKVIEGRPRTLVVPGTYKATPKHFSLQGVVRGESVEGKSTPVSLIGFLSAVPRGMEGAADIIFFIFIIGGVFGILQRTGLITATIQLMLEKFGGSGPILTVLIMVTLAIGGSTLGMGEEFIPLVPIFLIVSKRLGYDRIFGLAMVILAAQMGFAAATTNPFTVVIAQGIAELPLYSGSGFRLVFFACCLMLSITYVLRYGAKVRKDPSQSLMAGDDFHLEEGEVAVPRFTRMHFRLLLVCVLLFAGILAAVIIWGWWMAEMGGGFLLMGILAAYMAKLPMNEVSKSFVKGMEEMVVAALVVGFAKGIEVVMSDGMIMDTIIFSAATALQEVPKFVAAIGMFLFQTTLNLFIPSGSGQAAVTMPLMAPLADVLGLTRQTAVFAFQCGDGFSNTLIPTSGMLMAMLSLAKIPYATWLRFVLPLFLQLVVLSSIFLTIAVFIRL